MNRFSFGRAGRLLVIGAVNLLAIGCAHGAPPPWSESGSSIRWVDYSPSTANPDRGIEASTDAIRQDLAVLRQAKFTGLVTYSAKGRLGTEFVALAKAAGFRGVIIGVWDPKDTAEVAAAKQAAKSDIVLGICVGNEGVMGGRYSLEALDATIKDIRAATKKPVTTTETLDKYDAKLQSLVDWVFPNAHPYFSNVIEPKAAVEWTQAGFRRLTYGTSKFIMFKEVGLPTAGDASRPLSEEAQCEYYDALAKTRTRFVYFEGFDQSWKVRPAVEPHWGIFRSDRSPKALALRLTNSASCDNSATPQAINASQDSPAGPFYVYRDSNSSSNRFEPKGRMGDVDDIRIDDNWKTNPKSGNTSIRIEYLALGQNPTCDYSGPCRWAGVYWQWPGGNWGKVNQQDWKSEGYKLSGYKTLKFWARAERPSTIEFKVGGIVGPYGDSLRMARSLTVPLGSEWAEFTIDLEGADLSYIIGGFAFTASKQLNPHGAVFYLDDIRFEP